MTLQPQRGECYICGRGGVSLQKVGPTRMRHEECFPGSPNWIEWYAGLDRSQRTDAGDILFAHAMKG